MGNEARGAAGEGRASHAPSNLALSAAPPSPAALAPPPPRTPTSPSLHPNPVLRTTQATPHRCSASAALPPPSGTPRSAVMCSCNPPVRTEFLVRSPRVSFSCTCPSLTPFHPATPVPMTRRVIAADDAATHFPMTGIVESLHVATSAAVAIAEVVRRSGTWYKWYVRRRNVYTCALSVSVVPAEPAHLLETKARMSFFLTMATRGRRRDAARERSCRPLEVPRSYSHSGPGSGRPGVTNQAASMSGGSRFEQWLRRLEVSSPSSVGVASASRRQHELFVIVCEGPAGSL